MCRVISDIAASSPPARFHCYPRQLQWRSFTLKLCSNWQWLHDSSWKATTSISSVSLKCSMEKGGQLYCVRSASYFHFISTNKMLGKDRCWGAVVRAAAWLSPIHDYQMIGPQNNTGGGRLSNLCGGWEIQYTKHHNTVQKLCTTLQTGGYIANIKQRKPGLRIHQLSSGVMLITARGTHHHPAPVSLVSNAAPPLSPADDFSMEVSFAINAGQRTWR